MAKYQGPFIGGGPLDGQETQSLGSAMDLAPPEGDIPAEGQLIGEAAPLLQVRSDCVGGHLIAVTLGIELASESAGLPVVDDAVYSAVRAKIEWGVGDAHYEAEVDWQNGTQLSISAENIELAAIYVKATDPAAPADDPVFPTYRLNASFSYGNVGRNSNPARLTELVQITEVDGTARIEIPKFAISYTVIADRLTTYDTRQIGYSTVYGAEFSKTTVENNTLPATENIMPIANGMRFIDITNTNAGPMSAFVIFGLAL
jgi:hypothetical protein